MENVKKATLSVYPDLCDELGISPPTAYALVNREDFPKIRIGRRIRIPREGFERWLREHEGMQVRGAR